MKKCIICRLDKEEFNDEHVIPEAIKGYYHIYSVCTECNSNLGGLIDNKLTNHKFIEFQRHLLGIKGKNNTIPNPFAGTHTLKDNEEQKVKFEVDSEGVFKPILLPLVPKNIIGDSFTIVIDKKDESKKDEIIQKFLKTHGIPNDQVHIESSSMEGKPWIHTSLKIDIHNFKLGILKIAYEFAVDNVPSYFDDPTAILISKILHTADLDGLNEKVKMLGDGLNKQVLEPFSHLIDFENDNHYLILIDNDELGLLCFVNLFNVFSLGFIMSEKSGFIKEHLLVGKNDIEKHNFKIFNLSDIVSQVYTPSEYRFKYFIPEDHNMQKEFSENDKCKDFSFYRVADKIPFFDKDGAVKYNDLDDKLKQEHLQQIHKGDGKNDLITEIVLDEELYIRLLPINKNYMVSSVQHERYKRGRI